MIYKMISIFLGKNSKIRVKRTNGIYSDYLLELDDVEIRIPAEKLEELHRAIEEVRCNGKT